jgi:hypothetical protein
MIPAFIHASHLQNNVQLKKDDCIVFNEKGDMRIEKRAWDTHSDLISV